MLWTLDGSGPALAPEKLRTRERDQSGVVREPRSLSSSRAGTLHCVIPARRSSRYAPKKCWAKAIGFVFEEDLDATRAKCDRAPRSRDAKFDCRYVNKNGSVVPLAGLEWVRAEQQHTHRPGYDRA